MSQQKQIVIVICHRHEGTQELISELIESRGTPGERYMFYATSGAQAAAQTVKEESMVNLVIADSDMVGMSPEEFVSQVKDARPDVKIVMTVDQPGEGGPQVDMELKMVNLYARLDQILILASPTA